MAPPSKRLKYPTDGAPTVYLAHTIEDWDLEGPAADALGACGVAIYAEWSSGRLFEAFDEGAANQLRARLSLGDSWLVVLVSERTPQTGWIPWVLELARESMSPQRYAVLPVHRGPGAWSLPSAFLGYSRVEEHGDALVVVGPAPGVSLPLSHWFRPTTGLE